MSFVDKSIHVFLIFFNFALLFNLTLTLTINLFMQDFFGKPILHNQFVSLASYDEFCMFTVPFLLIVCLLLIFFSLTQIYLFYLIFDP